jgi:hypothetical protein
LYIICEYKHIPLKNTQEKLLINDRRVANTCPQTDVDCAIHKNAISTEKTLSITSLSPLCIIKISLKCMQYDERASRTTKPTSAVRLASACIRNAKLSLLVEISVKKKPFIHITQYNNK